MINEISDSYIQRFLSYHRLALNDLKANRNGLLSKRQFFYMVVYFLLWLFSSVFCFILASVFFTKYFYQSVSFLNFIFGVLFALPILPFLWKAFSLILDFISPKIEKITGRITVKFNKEVKSRFSLRYCIDKFEFEVIFFRMPKENEANLSFFIYPGQRVQWIIDPEKFYTIYYLKKSKAFLSIEPSEYS